MKKLCLIACLLFALALAACGDASREGAAEVEEAIQASVIDPKLSACKELRTQRYLEQSAQEPGKAALEDCEEDVGDPDNPTESVEISDVEVDGDAATALVAAAGGPLDGQVVELALVKEREQWKLDQVTRFAEFDAPALAQATETTLENSGDASTEQIECIGDKLEELSRPEAEVLVLSPRVTEELAELVQGCLGGSGAAAAGGQISPEGARYSYLVPAGFAVAKPEIRFQAAEAVSAVGIPGVEDLGQGILVGQLPSSLIRTPAELRRALPAIENGFEESAALVGADTSPAKTFAVDGRPAVQRETEGGTVGPFPGTDFRETLVFDGREAVLVLCRWKLGGEAEDAILEGCDSVLRSLRFPD